MDMKEFQFFKLVRVPKEKERIVFRVLEDCNLSRFILMDNSYDEDGNVSNVHRHSFVLPNMNVSKGDFLRVYTHKGEAKSFTNKSQTITHEIYWGFKSEVSIWNKDVDKAYIYKIDSLQVFRV